jgi:hypothetical protein
VAVFLPPGKIHIYPMINYDNNTKKKEENEKLQNEYGDLGVLF